MYLPLDLDKRPFLGVLIGAVSLAVWIVAFAVVYREYRGYGNTPAIVDLKTIAPPPENLGKWVQIKQPLLVDCALNVQEIRTPPESWLFGRVETTFFVAAIEGSKRNLLVVYEGDISCDRVVKQSFVGVLEELNSRRRSYLTSSGFMIPPGTDMQFRLGDGPASTRKLMLMGSFLPLVSIFAIVRFWPRWRAKVRLQESPFGT